jgi:hypothetical protein
MTLNVGYITVYTQERFSGYEIQIIKRPENILAAIRSEKPDIVNNILSANQLYFPPYICHEIEKTEHLCLTVRSQNSNS